MNWKLSQIITQDLQSICQTSRNDFDFDDENWFENRTIFVMSTLAKMKKKVSKASSLSQLYTSWHLKYLTVICK